MRLALISDIHANLEALQAVLKDIDSQNVDQIVCLGDVVGYGCDPIACLDLVTKSCLVTLMGNHEYAALRKLGDHTLNEVARASIIWTRNQLDDRHIKMISQFPMTHRIDTLQMVHASPLEPELWHYILTPPPALRAFEATDAWICFFGHSHLPSFFSMSEDGQCRSQFGHDFQPLDENRYLINVGSVGQPRDDDPRSCYVIFDSDTVDVFYRRVAYDFTVTQRKMAAVKSPTLLIERIAVGR